MKPVKLLEIGKEFGVKTQYGDKKKRMLKVQTLDTLQELEVGFWVKGDFVFQEGDTVIMDIKMNQSKGKKYWNSSYMEPFMLPDLPDKALAKDEPKEEQFTPSETDIWLDYFARLSEILRLFKETWGEGDKNIDTSMAGAILGLRELMFNKR